MRLFFLSNFSVACRNYCWARALILAAAAMFAPETRAGDCPELLRRDFKPLQGGEQQNLCDYQGKVLLVVNTASYCAHTDQYGGLEALYRDYRDQGLVVLGFPSNDFGGQEPGSSKQIADFCRLTYGVRFPMFEKSHVIGDARNPLFADLQQRTGVAPRWNFQKYLIDRSGQRVVSFDSAVAPENESLLGELRRMLAAGS